jgi:hypothetical protein
MHKWCNANIYVYLKSIQVSSSFVAQCSVKKYVLGFSVSVFKHRILQNIASFCGQYFRAVLFQILCNKRIFLPVDKSVTLETHILLRCETPWIWSVSKRESRGQDEFCGKFRRGDLCIVSGWRALLRRLSGPRASIMAPGRIECMALGGAGASNEIASNLIAILASRAPWWSGTRCADQAELHWGEREGGRERGTHMREGMWSGGSEEGKHVLHTRVM